MRMREREKTNTFYLPTHTHEQSKTINIDLYAHGGRNRIRITRVVVAYKKYVYTPINMYHTFCRLAIFRLTADWSVKWDNEVRCEVKIPTGHWNRHFLQSHCTIFHYASCALVTFGSHTDEMVQHRRRDDVTKCVSWLFINLSTKKRGCLRSESRVHRQLFHWRNVNF